MQIIEYFKSDRQPHWLEEIGRCEWRAAKFLVKLLREGRFRQMLGHGTLYLLTDGDALVSFLTLSERDCIDDESMTPWIGFVHTAPAYRGRRCAGVLLDHAVRVAGQHGTKQVYICTDHEGLYEKYGFTYLENRVSIYGEDSRVLVRMTERPLTTRFGQQDDLPQWMALVRRVAWNFPGLETEEALAAHEATVAKFIRRGSAICAADGGQVVGVLLFSPRRNMLCCMAVAPEYRRQGAAQGMFDLMLTIADPARELTVSTFCENDPRGDAPRAFYRKQGFVPGEMTVEFGCPNQIFVRRPDHAKG